MLKKFLALFFVMAFVLSSCANAIQEEFSTSIANTVVPDDGGSTNALETPVTVSSEEEPFIDTLYITSMFFPHTTRFLNILSTEKQLTTVNPKVLR